MPIFEYRCRECGAEFEKIVHSSDQEVRCRDCSGRQLDKLLSPFAVAGATEGRTMEAGPCACGAPRRGMCGE